MAVRTSVKRVKSRELTAHVRNVKKLPGVQQRLLSRSLAIIDERLNPTEVGEEPCLTTAKFVAKALLPPPRANTMIAAELRTVFEDYSDLADVSKECIRLVIEGKVSFEQATDLQKLITVHAGIEGYQKLTSLRGEMEELAKMKTIGSGHGGRAIPHDSRIEWGSGSAQPNHPGSGKKEPS